MQKQSIRENGLVGSLFSKAGSRSAVIILGGSSGGLPELRAENLAKEGFTVLALAYFGLESLPQRLNQIPLEYLEKALEFMGRFSDKVALWGISRGAELSLILGTLFPNKINAIAAHVPSSVVYGAFQEDSPAWLYQGKSIAPCAPFYYESSSLGESIADAIHTTPSFLKSMNDKKAFEASAICVEKLQCPLLLISAEDDQMWPSSLFAKQIVDRLEKFQSPIYYSHISYPDVGHAPGQGSVALHPVMKRWFAYGGTPAANAIAAEDWLRKTASFFKKALLEKL